MNFLGWCIHFCLALSGFLFSSAVAADSTTTALNHTTSTVADRTSPLVSTCDGIHDSLYDPIQADPDCTATSDSTCNDLPESTVEITQTTIDVTFCYGGDDPDTDTCINNNDSLNETQRASSTLFVDKHWGSDPNILTMRDKLRDSGSGASSKVRRGSNVDTKRPPIFLLPGLASTRLVAWKFKACAHPLLSDIKVQDYVWLNIQLIMQMSTIDVSCMRECLALGWNQSDTDDLATGCKLRPDEGLDAISSLSPGGIGSALLVGGTNTVYAWLIQWLADNLGYDVSNIVGLPYDWRMSPDKMEARDGFLTLTRRRIEAAVQSNGKPGIMVAHSMGNIIFRYFIQWMRSQLRDEAYQRYIKQAERRRKALKKQADAAESAHNVETHASSTSAFLPGWMSGVVSDFDEWWSSTASVETESDSLGKHGQLWELAQVEGDDNWIEWIETHIWSYIGLSAPMLGAVNPLRAVLSGESMGIPVSDEAARVMELTFGSTHTVNTISTKEGFCDQWDAVRWEEEPSEGSKESARNTDARLACMDDIFTEIEYDSEGNNRPGDPWEHYPALKGLLKHRQDWDSDFPMIKVTKEYCGDAEKAPCARNETLELGPRDVHDGNIFTQFSNIWKEKDDPLLIKRDQLRESFWDSKVWNILNHTWDRPLIKHVIMAYGVDLSTEVGYEYRKTERNATKTIDKAGNRDNDANFDGPPHLETALWETAGGLIEEEKVDHSKGGIGDFLKKKPKRTNVRPGGFQHSGDGSVPYLSLAWAHTWLLHAVRALRHSGKQGGPDNPLDAIEISHRPQGATEWEEGPPPKKVTVVGEKKFEESSDTGTSHPHGTKYKPEMVRYHNVGTSRTTGIVYTTTVIEASAVEHKETTRNFDILAAVFTDVLKFMHEDLKSE